MLWCLSQINPELPSRPAVSSSLRQPMNGKEHKVNGKEHKVMWERLHPYRGLCRLLQLVQRMSALHIRGICMDVKKNYFHPLKRYFIGFCHFQEHPSLSFNIH